MRIPRVALWMVLCWGASSFVSAQVPSDPKAAEFGPANLTHVRVGPYDFQPRDPTGSTLRILRPGGMAFYSETPEVLWEAPVHLPGGALLKRIELDFCDTNVAFERVALILKECDNQWQNCVNLADTFRVSDGSGCSYTATSSLSHRIDNFHKGYLLEAAINAGDGSNALGGAILSYALDVSPAPATASFGDVPTSSPQFQFVEALVAAGITAGCGGSNYCPNQPITRGQMAVFLAKALGLAWKDY